MKKIYIFFVRKVSVLILFITVFVLIFKLNFGIVFAQSLLSDPVWLKSIFSYYDKNNFYSNSNPQIASDLFFNQSMHYLKVKKIDKDRSKNNLKTLDFKKKTSFEYNQKKYSRKKFSESMLKRLFPWFSSEEVSKLDENYKIESKFDHLELADIEFSGIVMIIQNIQNLIPLNPEEALLKFLEIEDKLEIEDRTILKVQIHYFLKEWLKAEKLAKAFLREKPSSKNIPLIFYYLNKSLLAQGKKLYDNLNFREKTIKHLEPELRSDFLNILSNEAYISGNTLLALKYRLEELGYKKTSKYSNKKILLRYLKEIDSYEELKNLSDRYPNLKWLQHQIFLIKVDILLEQKRLREALSIVKYKLDLPDDISKKFHINYLNKIYNDLIKSLHKNHRKIGVILPFSSSNRKIAKLAQETLDGLWIALHANRISISNSQKTKKVNDFKNSKSKILDNSKLNELQKKIKKPWELIIRDSQLNGEVTKNLVHDLVKKENVVAIIGPLARKTSEAAAEEAEKLKVPLISLSLTDSIPNLGEYIFRNNKSWKQEVSELINYAVSELRACRFAILFAETREGRQKMRFFWEETLKKKCEIIAVEGFKDDGQKSLVKEFDTFTGKNLFIDLEDQNILKELKEKEDPIHNFDAVFVAVGSGGVKNLRLIFPYSSVYKMEKITFLGDSGWNDLAIKFAPGLKGIKNPIFVDSFFIGSKTNSMETLMNLHERILYKHQNYVRPSAYTAHAYDTLMILLDLLKEEKNQSHRVLKESLLKMKPFPGVTGELSFNINGEIKRELKLLTLRRGEVKPLFKELTK